MRGAKYGVLAFRMSIDPPRVTTVFRNGLCILTFWKNTSLRVKAMCFFFLLFVLIQMKGQTAACNSERFRSQSWHAPELFPRSRGPALLFRAIRVLPCIGYWQKPVCDFIVKKPVSLSNALTDRVKHHDLYLSAGCCSCAVNVILKPLYPLFEDLQYSRLHVSLSLHLSYTISSPVGDP